MYRRAFVATGVTGIVGVAGYISLTSGDTGDESTNTEPNVPASMTVKTHYPNDDVVDRDQYEFLGPEETAIHILDDRETANESIEPPTASVTSFIEETVFNESYLLVVRRGMESRPDLKLAAIERRDNGLHLKITIVPPKGDTESDLVNQSLLIRVTDNIAPPDSVTVDFRRE